MKRILIVEDDALLHKTLAYNLTSDGWDVTSALWRATDVRRGLLFVIGYGKMLTRKDVRTMIELY